MLRSNAQHLLLSPDNVISSLESCIADVEQLNSNVVKLHDMLSTKFEQLEKRITSLTVIPDPTKSILEGVADLLTIYNKQQTVGPIRRCKLLLR